MRRTVSFLVLGVGLALALSSIAQASASVDPSTARASLGPSSEALASGLYRIAPDRGEALLSHGPDAPSASQPRLSRTAPERPPVCASERHQRVLVGHLVSQPDRAPAVADQVRAAVRRVNAVLSRDSVASGGPAADFRVACDASGEIAVDSFAASSPRFEDVVEGARAAGFNRADVNYTIFFDSPAIGGFCGMASYVADSRLLAENRNNDGGAFAVTYQPCWDTLALLHEVAHNQGAVQPEAPNSTGSGGHCNQFLDVVCVAPDGGDRNQFSVLACPELARFDCGFDDYFDSAPEPGEYLATHWNLGSALNRFIDLGGDPATTTTPASPCAREACAIRLHSDTPLAGRVDDGGQTLYRVRAPRRAAALRFSLRSAAGLELRVRHGRPPLANAPGCAAGVCRIGDPKRGEWFASVSGGSGDFEILAGVR